MLFNITVVSALNNENKSTSSYFFQLEQKTQSRSNLTQIATRTDVLQDADIGPILPLVLDGEGQEKRGKLPLANEITT